MDCVPHFSLLLFFDYGEWITSYSKANNSINMSSAEGPFFGTVDGVDIVDQIMCLISGCMLWRIKRIQVDLGRAEVSTV